MNFKNTLTMILASVLITLPIASCENNLDIPQKETITLNTSHEYTYTKMGYTEETWDVTVTGIYAVGKTDSDKEGNCYVITQKVTPLSTENSEGTAEYPPDVEVLFNGKVAPETILSNTCDFEQVREDGYTGSVEGVIGEEYKKVSVQYIMNSDLPKVSGIMIGSLNNKNVFDDPKIIPLTENDIKDYPVNK